jgi:hypothetical protein
MSWRRQCRTCQGRPVAGLSGSRKVWNESLVGLLLARRGARCGTLPGPRGGPSAAGRYPLSRRAVSPFATNIWCASFWAAAVDKDSPRASSYRWLGPANPPLSATVAASVVSRSCWPFGTQRTGPSACFGARQRGWPPVGCWALGAHRVPQIHNSSLDALFLALHGFAIVRQNIVCRSM